MHGGIAFQRTPGWQYRAMTDQGVMKNCSGRVDKDLVDLNGTIVRSLHNLLPAVPESLLDPSSARAGGIGNILKGQAAIKLLQELLCEHSFFAPYRELGAAQSSGSIQHDDVVLRFG